MTDKDQDILTITKMSSTKYSFKFKNESHTFGELVTNRALTRDDVVVSNYIVNHPLTKECIIYIDSKKDKDSNKIMISILDDLQKVFETIEKSFI